MATVEHVDRTLGPAAATEVLYRRHRSRVLRYCQRCLRRPADAEDALQQTFLQAHRALGRGVEPVAEATWLLTIARNVCLTRIDARRRRARVEYAEDPIVLAASAGAGDSGPELSEETVHALMRLPERQRQALFLREWQELSYAEIAVALATTESAVETLIFRARKSLAIELGGEKRRRRGFDLAALLGWSRTVSEVAVPKLGAGAACVLAVAGAGVATSDSAPRVARQAAVALAAPAPDFVPVRAGQPARTALGPRGQARPRVAHAPSIALAAGAGVAPEPAAPLASGDAVRVAPSHPSTAPAAPHAALVPAAAAHAVTAVPAATVPAAPVGQPTPLGPVLDPVLAVVPAPVAAVVDSTVQTAAATVPAVTAPVGQAAQDVVKTTETTTSTVATVVHSLLPGH